MKTKTLKVEDVRRNNYAKMAYNKFNELRNATQCGAHLQDCGLFNNEEFDHYTFMKVIEHLGELDVIDFPRVGEIISCLENESPLSEKDDGQDLLDGKDVKTSVSLQKSSKSGIRNQIVIPAKNKKSLDIHWTSPIDGRSWRTKISNLMGRGTFTCTVDLSTNTPNSNRYFKNQWVLV